MAICTLLFQVLVGLLMFVSVKSEFIEYNTSGKLVSGKINVHLVPHTHDDVGWLKTVDQYYVGANNSIRGACVQNVLDSVISSLLEDENRKFIYVEMAFFKRWWRQQSPKLKAKVKELVNSGQLEFINGGWCMHDEATPHYIDLIDQTTLGHRFIKDEFDQMPRVGWQIDPFGHSAVQGYLLGAELGFDSLYFARIDYQDRAKRKNEKTLEMVWRGSRSLGSTSQIFTGIFPVHYNPPDGFQFEINDASPPVQDDPLLFGFNVQERVNDFVAAAVAQANITRTNHIMWTMGEDFRYQYANSWYRQMDKLIHYVNLDGRVNALYSTPSLYTDAKHAANETWPVKTDDFFPYADRANAYWTGYFTSRPAFKGYVRAMSGYYLAARQLEFLKGRNGSVSQTETLAAALAISQHHDAVSGTERQHVADDYTLRLHTGYLEAEKVVSSSLTSLTSTHGESQTSFQQCPLLNISYCPPSEEILPKGKSLVVVVYNSLGWKRDEVIRIPVNVDKVLVQDSKGKEVESQLLPLTNASLSIRNDHLKAYLGKQPDGATKHWLAFHVSVPPLGFSTYIVSSSQAGTKSAVSTTFTVEGNANNTIKVGQGNLKLLYSASKGTLTRYINNRNMVNAVTEQSYSYYSGFSGTDADSQASGAYIFRPNGTFSIGTQKQASLTVMRGPLFDEVHQQPTPWIYQVTRVYKGKEHAEVEFTIGPIPIDDGVGKEVVTQIRTPMKTNRTFYTDSNGRDFIKRIRDYREDWNLEVSQPIAGNYYPINLGIFIKDENTELSVLVDRAVGGSSIMDGQVELMLHRRLLHDDARGVGEVLNETVCSHDECKGLTIKGKYFVRIDRTGEGARWRRTFGQEIYSPLILAFAEQDNDDWSSSHVPVFSGITASYSLPDNVAIITLQELDNGKVLLRLAHLYETGEDKDLSAMANVELKKLFPNKTVTKVTEMNLSANQERVEMERKRLVWKAEDSSDKETQVSRGGPVNPVDLLVELGPMEIRTFLVDVEYIQM
ncbi:alpha-mannosidase At3g26720-like isoform X3 [Silene latifolia]|uniref:alpha-mannosidase At3g26720-like isoform X3 n=1 Tax=Silene latifolia TaxID=37657 RepID=UPI003D76D018